MTSRQVLPGTRERSAGAHGVSPWCLRWASPRPWPARPTGVWLRGTAAVDSEITPVNNGGLLKLTYFAASHPDVRRQALPRLCPGHVALAGRVLTARLGAHALLLDHA